MKGDLQLRSVLKFVSEVLSPGGYFFGTTTDSAAIWTLAQKEITHRESHKRRGYSLSNEVRVKAKLFEVELPDGDNIKTVGTAYNVRYRNQLQKDSGYLVHFPTLVERAKEVGLRMVEIANFREFWDEHRKTSQDLLSTIIAKEFPSGDVPPLSSHDLEVFSLFCTFVFIRD